MGTILLIVLLILLFGGGGGYYGYNRYGGRGLGGVFGSGAHHYRRAVAARGYRKVWNARARF